MWIVSFEYWIWNVGPHLSGLILGISIEGLFINDVKKTWIFELLPGFVLFVRLSHILRPPYPPWNWTSFMNNPPKIANFLNLSRHACFIMPKILSSACFGSAFSNHAIVQFLIQFSESQSRCLVRRYTNPSKIDNSNNNNTVEEFYAL